MPADLTQSVIDWELHRGAGVEEAFDVAYAELRKLAAAYVRREQHHTVQPTELVHELFLKLVDGTRVTWQGRAHFMGVAARALRQLLVDRARRRNARKRRGDITHLSVNLADPAAGREDLEIEALEEALVRLAELDPRQARIVELRYFAGLTIEETAAALDLSPATVKREWTHARAWLYHQIRSGP